ncbi:MAG: 50S ribosomal protein L4, partial [Cyclobacteriaceae bacterium]
DYGFKLNKKLKSLARKSALTYKAQEKSITVLEDFSFESPKTKEYIGILKGLSLGDKKTLVVMPEGDKNVYLSGRNLANSKVTTPDELNTYDLLHADTLVLCESSIEKIQSLLK